MIQTTLDGKSEDIVSDNIEKLKEIFPEIVTEDKIDFDKLKLILGENVETDRERYNFTWPGKTQAIKESQKQSTGTLRPCKEESKNWDTTQNLYIEGDNLEVLKLLQKTYYKKIKMIYIDPPYNTGNDFIYNDDYSDNLEHYLEISGQSVNSSKKNSGITLSSNLETNGRYHSYWLNMMYPRLKLARNLLTEDGVIVISIDDNEVENLKKICNEIFSEENFVGDIIRKTKSSTNDIKTGLNIQHENTLIYAKSINLVNLKGRNKQFDNYKNPDNDPNGPWTSSDPTVPRSGYDFEIENPFTKKIDIPPIGRCWQFSKEKFNEYLKNGKIKFKKEYSDNQRGFIFKRYLNELRGTRNKVNSLEFSTNEYMNQKGTKDLISLFDSKIFNHPKPNNFLSTLIYYILDDGIILDFFSGSGVTAEGCLLNNSMNNENNKFIMVQIPEETTKKSEAYKAGYKNICEIGKERIRRAGDKILEKSDNKDLDIGFKVFKLDSSNLQKWDPDYNNITESLDKYVDNIKTDRTEEDLVYEIMLKYGIDLTLPIQKENAENHTIYSVGYGALLICLDDNITKEIIKPIIDLSKNTISTRVVFKDNGFKSDSDKTNIKETLKVNNIEELITI
jgi:adenine-specific DNA-methyltransferase